MQNMHAIKTSLFSRRGLVASVAAIGVLALALFLIPQKINVKTSADNCVNPPTTPTFNNWPVTYDRANTPLCHDFAAIDAAIDTANPQFSTSQADWDNGLQMATDQQGVALIYIHNGAANNLDPALTTAKNVKIQTVTSSTVGSAHTISVTFTADNAPSFSRSFTIHTPANSQLEVLPNSGFMYDYMGRLILDQQNLNLGNSTFTLGDLDACFEYSLFLSFKFKVKTHVPVEENTTLTIDKQVRNTTTGGAYQASVDAKNGDKLEYRIKVRNTGNSIARGVTVSDNGVGGINVTSNSTTVGIADDALIPNNLWQGTIPGTVNIGDIPVNQERVITYTGTVASAQCVSLTNTARAQASNAPSVSDSAVVRVVGCVTPGDRNITIEKLVRNENHNTNFAKSVSIRTGEWATWKVTVRNTGNLDIQNVILDDILPAGMNLDRDSIRLDSPNTARITTIRDINLGTLRAGESRVLTFSSQVTATGTQTICNEATVRGDGVGTKRDTACVNITVTDKPGNPNIVKAKRAHNDTKNADATTVNASREDFITYTLVTTNTGNANANNFVISDDLSKVLPFADIVDAGGGAVSGQTITYPGVTIRPGETITKTFKVRVKHSLQENLSYQLINTYGNTVVVNIPGKVIYHAPKTGAAGTSAAAFAGLITAGFVAVRNGRSILNFIKA